MRYFQIYNDICYWDASNVVSSPEEAAERFAPDIVIVEAPDYVREGWGFDASRGGDDRFIRPEPPDGWEYDDETGTMYRPGDLPAGETDIWDELAAAYTEGVNNA